MIKQVTDIISANKCDVLLNKLILDERQYDNTIDETFTISNYFCQKINQSDSILLGYYIENEIVGYIYIRETDTENKICLLDGMYVLENYRNKGIASELIKEALKLCQEKGYRYVDINVMYKNELAKKIYKKIGFKEFRLSFRKEI